MVENDNGRMDIELNKTMEFIGGVIEGVIKTYICFVNGCFSIQNGKVADPTIDLGVMPHKVPSLLLRRNRQGCYIFCHISRYAGK